MSKHHHHVPQFILKNFYGAKNLYYFNKNWPDKGIESRNKSSVFQKHHLYSIKNRDGTLDSSIETGHFKDIDTQTDPIVTKIIERVRNNELPNLSTTEKVTWDRFFIDQIFRSPEQMNSPSTIGTINRIFDEETKVINRLLRENNRDDLIKLLNKPEFQERVKQGAIRKSLISDRKKPLRVLNERGLYIAKITNLNKSFIIGSNALVRYNNSGTDNLEDETVELWFPISWDIAISPGPANKKEMFLPVRDRVIRKTNLIIARQSDEVASRSRQLLVSLLNKSGYLEQIKVR